MLSLRAVTFWSVVAAGSTEGPGAFVDRWHEALRGERREAVLEFMAADAVIFEGGEAESARDEYAQSHLDADMEFSRATNTVIENRRLLEGADSAVVRSQTLTTGIFKGERLSSRGAGTMVLRRLEQGWLVAHIHWSSRRVPLRIASSPSAQPQSASPKPAATGRSAPQAQVSTEGLVSQLRSAGLAVQVQSDVSQPFFAVPAHPMTVGDDELQVFEFPSPAAAEQAAASVSANGGTIGTSAVHWIAPPHFYRKDRTLVIHLGNRTDVRSALERMLGPAFADRP